MLKRQHVFMFPSGVLQVGIHRDNRLPPGVIQSAGQGGFLAEIAGQVQDPDARVLPAGLQQQVQGIVPAAVVYADDFKCVAQGGENRQNFIQKRLDIFLFIMHGADDGEQGRVVWCCLIVHIV